MRIKQEAVSMFFNRQKRKKEIMIHSPLKGELISLEEVSDPVFSQKMMGEGVGLIPTSGEVFSPVDGEVTQVFPTKHAIGMVTEKGIEVLLHLGLDTVELNGEGFNIEVEVGNKLKINDRIGAFSLPFIEEKGKKTTSVLVFPNFTEQVEKQIIMKKGDVNPGAEVIELRLK